MAVRSKPDDAMKPLARDQAHAVVPHENIWLSASAGTGKTQVLSARVLRLLLEDKVDPEHILCLTFTKAGAAEMANRIQSDLARWVRLKGTLLRDDLSAIGARGDPATRERARTLFARVLDARGGGLRIMTIHSFCQALLAAFPEEADIAPLFRPIEERDQRIMAREAMGDMLTAAEKSGNNELVSAVETLSLRMGEEATEKYLLQCAGAAEAMETLPSGIAAFARALLNLPVSRNADEWLAEKLTDAAFDVAALRQLSAANLSWDTKTGQRTAAAMNDWLAADVATRVAQFDTLHKLFATDKGQLRQTKPGLEKADPASPDLMAKLYETTSALKEQMTLFGYAEMLTAGLTAGRAFYFAYDAAKRARGTLDFDDMIRKTAALLNKSAMSEWIRYKLDQRTDHILIDEAQDTNQAQWDIIKALSSDFFAGEGAGQGRLRTIFTVGDYKQAIFSFQGTSPEFYAKAQRDFAMLAENVGQDFRDLDLARSFRSSQTVLNVVDAVIDHVGFAEMGLKARPQDHISHFPESGTVTLWKPVASFGDANASEQDDEEEDWLSDEKRRFAEQLAQQIKAWVSSDNGLWLPRKGRIAQPGDIMILVSKRDELGPLIVARLAELGVRVAGIDRIRLDQPLVVRDLLAALRFVLQPADDLNLACLLVSPLIGWSQERLLEYGYRSADMPDRSLWGHLRDQPELAEDIAPLRSLLGMADFVTPYQFVENILSGPMRARQKLLTRLGNAALDPIEELVNAVLRYEADHVPTLQGFIDWFDRGKVEIKRDQGEAADEVRLMTVHGAKGLQAPIVILANAAFDPAKKKPNPFTIPDPHQDPEGPQYPAIAPRKSEQLGLLSAYATIAGAEAMQEHWRLLYVAMTRAEEHLFVAGTLGRGAKGEVPPDSWYVAIDNALQKLGAAQVDDPDWGMIRRFGDCENLSAKAAATAMEKIVDNFVLPPWALRSAPQEEQPPRPLAPSAAEPDLTPGIVPEAGRLAAAQRGIILHSLFQRLPDLPPNMRETAADNWLLHQKTVADPAERQALIETALRVIDHPDWAALFSPEALAEAPLAATVGTRVIAGTVDRMLVTPDHIQLVDFKTGTVVPENLASVPIAHIRQMAAYCAALEVIFPDRQISAGLLYSSAPVLIALPDALLATHKPGLSDA